MKAHILIAAAAIFAATPVVADVYKWTDTAGKVHYSDKPQSLAAERLKLRTARTDYQRLEDDRQQGIESAEQQAAAASKTAEEAERQANVDRINAENCEKAQRNLNRVLSAQRLYEVDATGERTYLDEAQIESRRQAARDDVSKYCNE